MTRAFVRSRQPSRALLGALVAVAHLATSGCAGTDQRTRRTAPPPSIIKIALGHKHSCALSTEGDVYCWGLTRHGEIAVHPTDALNCTAMKWPCRFEPTKVGGLPPARDIAAKGEHTCVITRDSRVFCWGLKFGSGIGAFDPDGRCELTPQHSACEFVSTPVPMEKLRGARGLAVGYGMLCGLFDDHVRCVGWQRKEGLGLCDRKDERIDVEIRKPFGGVRELSLGLSHSCAVTSEGVSCVGRNVRGSVGVKGLYGPCVPLVEPSTVELDARRVEVAAEHTCALDAEGQLWCWGNNIDSAIGLPMPDEPPPLDVAWSEQVIHHEPIRTAFETAVVDFGVFEGPRSSTEAITEGGHLYYACPDGFCRDPVIKQFFRNPRQMGTGSGHVCVLEERGVFCWGRNAAGQCGSRPRAETERQAVHVPGLAGPGGAIHGTRR